MKETLEHRSRVMRAVKSAGTQPELIVRRLVHSLGFRYRLNRADLAGKPDLVFSGRRKVIFVHGCFWHGHSCPRGARLPKTNTDYWKIKITRNRARDERARTALEQTGWAVLVLWECELKDEDALAEIIVRFLET